MKIVYPMQLAGEGAPKEIASLDEFIKKLSKLNSGTFPIGRNRIWHGGIHLSEKGGWHSSGAVRAIADGEIVAYRFASEPAKATRKSEAGKPESQLDLYTSPSFCLVRHRYEAGEKNKNSLTFYSLYMHIACENSYSAEPERHVVVGGGVSIYKGTAGLQLKAEDKLGVARQGAEVTLMDKNNPSERYNLSKEPHMYQLVCYADPKEGDPEQFYIAAQYIKGEHKAKPHWMMPPESKPARYKVPNNTWLRQTAKSTEGSAGLPAGSEVVVLGEQQMVTINGGPTEFRQVQVFKAGSGTVKNSANQAMANASKGAVGWLAKSKIGAALAAESSTAIELNKVVNRDKNPIVVQAGEVIGHWGEHQVATSSASGFSLDPDQKAVHFEVFVAEKDTQDKQMLNDCIQNKAQVTGGQDYLVIKKNAVDTCRLTNHKNQPSYENVAKFGPLTVPLAVKKADIVTHGTQKFVRVRERAAAKGELAGEFVLLAGDTELLSQHDWDKLGVKLVDGSSDPDGFLDKQDTEGQEGGAFFSTLYDRLTIDRDNDNVLSGDEIKSALADDDLANKLRRLFIKHESEWIKREKGWPRLQKELAEQPKLYEYAMQVHNNMAWVEDAKEILGNSKMWFIHPAGMMGLVSGAKVYECITFDMVFAANHYKNKSICEEATLYLNFYAGINKMRDLKVIAHFLSQIAHESSFSNAREDLYYSPKQMRKIFGCKGGAKNYNTDTDDCKRGQLRRKLWSEADKYSRNPKELGNYAYADRMGNDREESGDGYKYRGRGVIQLTGKAMYHDFTGYHNAKNPEDKQDFVKNPDSVSENKLYAFESAFFYWYSNSSLGNHVGDKTVKQVTQIVNGGQNGYEDRRSRFNRVAEVIGIELDTE